MLENNTKVITQNHKLFLLRKVHIHWTTSVMKDSCQIIFIEKEFSPGFENITCCNVVFHVQILLLDTLFLELRKRYQLYEVRAPII